MKVPLLSGLSLLAALVWTGALAADPGPLAPEVIEKHGALFAGEELDQGIGAVAGIDVGILHRLRPALEQCFGHRRVGLGEMPLDRSHERISRAFDPRAADASQDRHAPSFVG